MWTAYQIPACTRRYCLYVCLQAEFLWYRLAQDRLGWRQLSGLYVPSWDPDPDYQACCLHAYIHVSFKEHNQGCKLAYISVSTYLSYITLPKIAVSHCHWGGEQRGEGCGGGQM